MSADRVAALTEERIILSALLEKTERERDALLHELDRQRTERRAWEIDCKRALGRQREMETLAGEKIAALAQANDRASALQALLAEWRRTPFFASKEAWQAWVKKFGRRVDAALAAEVQS